MEKQPLDIAKRNEFDLEIVLQGFQKCKQLDGSILLDEYLIAFTELCRYKTISFKN